MTRNHKMGSIIQGFCCVSINVLMLISTPAVTVTSTPRTFFVSINNAPMKKQEPHTPGAYSQLYILSFSNFFLQEFLIRENQKHFFSYNLAGNKITKINHNCFSAKSKISWFHA